MNFKKLKEELRRDEGCELKPYHCTAGKLTIGFGRNLDDSGITEDEAEYLLNSDVKKRASELDTLIPWWTNLTDNRQRALLNMSFQLGVNGLLKFKKMIQALECGNYRAACLEGLDSNWAKQTPQRAYRVTKMILEG